MVTVNVTSVPTLTLDTNSYSICVGNSQTFTVSGASTYTWSPGLPTLTGSNTANPTASPTTTTIYTVTGTASGCAPSPQVTLTLNINPLPTLSLASPSYSVCDGSSQTFTVSGASTYTWSPAATLTGANTANPTATTNTTTTYSVTGTDANGCISSAPATITLTINASPTLTLTAAGSGTVCSGSSTVLTATCTGITNATYSWSTGSSTSTNTLNVTPASSPEIYSVTATNTVTGCSSTTATTAVIISPTPTIAVTNPIGGNSSIICLNNSVTLTATGASTYTWMPVTGLTPTTGSVVNASPTNTNTPTVYTVTGTSAAGCLSSSTPSDMYTVTVNPLPVLSVSSASYAVCSGVAQTFSVSGAATYTWTPAATLTGANTANPTATTNTTTTYSVTGMDATGCSSVIPDTVQLIIYPLPSINVSTSSIAADTCGKNTGGVTNIAVSGGTPNYFYQWFNTNTGALVSTSPTLSNVSNGTYSLEVIDTHSCVATTTTGVPPIFVVNTVNVQASFLAGTLVSTIASYSTTATAAVNPLTGTTPLAVSFTNTSSTGSCIWSFGDTVSTPAITTITNHTYNVVGTYTVTLIASNGSCMDTAYAIVITDAPTSIIIPNIFSPNGDGINDDFFIINTGLNSLNCLIYNRWGELLATLTAPNQVWDGRTPNGGNAPDGTYFYIMQAQGTNGKTYKQNGPLTLVR
jgi:gliding motility-associated-like protein